MLGVKTEVVDAADAEGIKRSLLALNIPAGSLYGSAFSCPYRGFMVHL